MYWHFLVMVMLIMIVAGAIVFLFPRFPFYIVLVGSGLIGYVYATMAYLEDILFIIIAVNVLAMPIPIVLAKWTYYLKHKADEMERQIRNG